MKTLKNLVLSLFVLISVAGFSASAIAAGPREAIDSVVAKIAEADQAIDEGSNTSAEIVDLIREAGDLVKNIISQSDAFDSKRQRANGHLKKARGAAKKGDLVAAKEHLEKATQAFSKLKKQI